MLCLEHVYFWVLFCLAQCLNLDSTHDQVKEFWKIMLDGPEDVSSPNGMKMPSKTHIYADAWGIRKLISHSLRNLRMDRLPKVVWLAPIAVKNMKQNGPL